MRKLTFTIEKGTYNYSCFSEQVLGVAVAGDTLSELKKLTEQALKEHIELLKEYGEEIPEILKNSYTLSFVFDVQSVLQYYSNILSRSALSRLTGINEKQLGHYIQGLHKPRKDKAKKIEKALHNLGKELLLVEL